jgi:hypothetical protein
MLDSDKLRAVVSPFNNFPPLLKVFLVFEYNPVSFDLLACDLISKNVELSIFGAIVNILMSDVFP